MTKTALSAMSNVITKKTTFSVFLQVDGRKKC